MLPHTKKLRRRLKAFSGTLVVFMQCDSYFAYDILTISDLTKTTHYADDIISRALVRGFK